MAQRRLISRTLGASQKFMLLHGASGKLGDFAQCLYALMIPHADDHGRLEGEAMSIKLSVFPASPHSAIDFEKALTAMDAVGLVILYGTNGRRYLEITNFRREQPGIKYIANSRFPEPPTESQHNQPLTGFRRDSPVPAKLGYEVRNETKRNEEKGSEEKHSSDRSEKRSSSQPLAAAGPSVPVVAIPLNTNDEFLVTQAMADEWKALYPAVDVLQHLRGMRGWSLANPRRRKTRKGILRFINAWLEDKQNKAEPGGVAGRSRRETVEEHNARVFAELEADEKRRS